MAGRTEGLRPPPQGRGRSGRPRSLGPPSGGRTPLFGPFSIFPFPKLLQEGVSRTRGGRGNPIWRRASPRGDGRRRGCILFRRGGGPVFSIVEPGGKTGHRERWASKWCCRAGLCVQWVGWAGPGPQGCGFHLETTTFRPPEDRFHAGGARGPPGTPEGEREKAEPPTGIKPRGMVKTGVGSVPGPAGRSQGGPWGLGAQGPA